MMMRRRTLLLILVVIAGCVAWYLFRPERLFVNANVNETFPTSSADTSPSTASAAKLLSGTFHSVAHQSSGSATIYKLADGNRVLRLTDFETSNGPDVHVYLVAASDASDNNTVTGSGFIDLGSLKGNIGDQNYDLPSSADLNTYRAVTIWCRRFSVNFATAALAQ
jgi:hypothetical protein